MLYTYLNPSVLHFWSSWLVLSALYFLLRLQTTLSMDTKISVNGQSSDMDTLVKLHTLCRECERVAQDSQLLHHPPGSPSAPPSMETFKHQQSTIHLSDAAQNGCHMCSLYKKALDPHIESLEALKRACFTPESDDIEQRDTTYVLQLQTVRSPTKVLPTLITVTAKFSDVDSLYKGNPNVGATYLSIVDAKTNPSNLVSPSNISTPSIPCFELLAIIFQEGQIFQLPTLFPLPFSTVS